MSAILCIIIFLALGMGLGFVLRRRPALLRAADRVASLAVFALLFVLGAGLGGNAELFARLPILGGTALCITLFSCAGSILFLRLLQHSFDPGPRKSPVAGASGPSPLWGTLRILACFIVGLILARLALLPDFIFHDGLVVYALWLLVFCVGVSLGAELKAFAVVREMHVKILAVPLLIVLGTMVGALAASLVLPGLTPRDALAVGCGFGYYSLSSLLIENMGYPTLAAVALLSNIFRELLGILGAPVIARFCGSLGPVAASGATAMDTGLPVIARYSGERAAIAAVFSGMSLTILVPFLVAAIMSW